MNIYPGLCKCGSKLDFRYSDFREDENNIGTIKGYIVYGLCEDCHKVIVFGLFMDKLPPELNWDFKIDWKEKVKDSHNFDDLLEYINKKRKKK